MKIYSLFTLGSNDMMQNMQQRTKKNRTDIHFHFNGFNLTLTLHCTSFTLSLSPSICLFISLTIFLSPIWYIANSFFSHLFFCSHSVCAVSLFSVVLFDVVLPFHYMHTHTHIETWKMRWERKKKYENT